MQAVVLEKDVLTMSGLAACIVEGGKRGGNLIQEYDEGMRITLRRPARDLYHRVPAFGVRAYSPHASYKMLHQ